MKKPIARRLVATALAVLIALPAVARAADDVSDFWPAQEALTACGQVYVRDSAAPTVGGAQARCAAEFERLMRTVATMTRLSQPRMGDATPEWEQQVETAVEKKRASLRSDFANRVTVWIAEKKKG